MMMMMITLDLWMSGNNNNLFICYCPLDAIWNESMTLFHCHNFIQAYPEPRHVLLHSSPRTILITHII